MLRPVSIVGSLGVTSLNGLVGNVAIPRQTAASTVYWLAENGEPTESAQAFDQLPMSPRTLAAYTDVSRKLLLQSSIDMSAFVTYDLRASFGQELDRVILTGSGSGSEPAGILNNTDVPLVGLGTNGAALSWADVVGLYTAVASENAAMTSAGFVTTKGVRGKLMQTEKVASTAAMIWDAPSISEARYPGEGTIGSTRAVSSTLMPDNLTKGSGTDLHSMIYGDFSEIVVGTWGSGFELILDPYTLAKSGGVRIVAMMDVDMAIRHPKAFVRVKDIIA
jgi:HK97 family phage major capsid protein